MRLYFVYITEHENTGEKTTRIREGLDDFSDDIARGNRVGSNIIQAFQFAEEDNSSKYAGALLICNNYINKQMTEEDLLKEISALGGIIITIDEGIEIDFT
ncbi:hypothetical protein ACFL08_00355 [Patescibacteria group bacterium]